MKNELKIKNTKYSFLISVYYKEKPEYLKMSFDSMINQTIKPDEIVLVEDGKLTPELYEVINKYSNENKNLFNIVVLNENVGLGLALNAGLKVCKNELVARMDTDDVCLPNRCEQQLERFEKNDNLDIVGSMTDEFIGTIDNIVSSRIVPTTHEKIMKFAKRRSPFNHPTVMYKKSKVMEVGGYGNYRRAQDYDLFMRMLNEGQAIGENIDKSLIYFRADENNIKRRSSFNACKCHIQMVYGFWNKGYVSLFDFLVIICYQCVIFIVPSQIVKLITNKFLRKSKK